MRTARKKKEEPTEIEYPISEEDYSDGFPLEPWSSPDDCLGTPRPASRVVQAFIVGKLNQALRPPVQIFPWTCCCTLRFPKQMHRATTLHGKVLSKGVPPLGYQHDTYHSSGSKPTG
jgi:hypothetical protein